MRLLLLLLCALLISCQPKEQFNQKMVVKIQDAVKRDDIMGRIHLFFRSIDNKDWESAEKISSVEIVSKLKDELKSADKTFHLVGNYGIEVDNNKAKLLFVGVSTQFKKGKSKRSQVAKSLHRSYEVHMVQPEGDPTNWEWQIKTMSFENKFESQN